MVVTFTGDISITGSFTNKVRNNSEIFSDAILTNFETSDFVVGNLEGATTNSQKHYNFNTPLKSPVKTIRYLADRNMTVFNLANNHILDYGEIGLQDTLSIITKENCSYFGADFHSKNVKKPLILENKGIKIALFGIAKCNPIQINNAQLFSADEFITLKKQIRAYKTKVDFVFVNFHGGEEFSLYPSPVKRKFLKKIAALQSVDCVIAHHSHTLQGFEKYKNTPIFYSLGNFIFDIPNHKPYTATDNSALLRFSFTKENFSFSFIPYKLEDGFISDVNKTIFDDIFKQLNNFFDYKNKWQKEAHRILFRKQNPYFEDQPKDENSLQEKSFFAVLFSIKFYKKIASILKDKYQFSLYYNAVIYKLKTKLNL
jgi:poly-gamma-glutamate synthesis protein (capsule biosynthesis protein)